MAFENIFRMLRPGGLFIWHDRLWDAYHGTPGTGPRNGGSLREFQLHPIRLKTTFADRFTALFDSVYESRDTPELRRLRNQGIYFIGRKKHADVGLPSMVAPAAVEKSALTLVVTLHPGSQRTAHLLPLLKAYHAMPIVRYLVLVLNGGAPAPFDLEPFASKLILKSFADDSAINRFRIAREVLTEAVVFVGEGVKMREPLLQCLHERWASDKDRVLGIEPIQESAAGGYAFLSGAAMLFSRTYLDAYLSDETVVARTGAARAVGTPHSCEDLAMVAMVGKLTGKPPLAIHPGETGEMYSRLGEQGSGLGLGGSRHDTGSVGCAAWLHEHHELSFSTEPDWRTCSGTLIEEL